MSNDPLLTYLALQLRLRAARLRGAKGDAGAVSIEAAVLIGFLVAMALGLGAFLLNKLTEKEGQIK
ncbi:hypothetical protein [Kitasatospora sp. GP82]|uniref:hypothetical protein n=1 Tax=Kitasatospora sp. GP82 TaxID=3035089 RepID=UPI0024770150|nr:hypothetical protein [Kitasatospora sp. GP82]MDH6130510.1 hypothetical protein [Kitasatospora sp. GP82]